MGTTTVFRDHAKGWSLATWITTGLGVVLLIVCWASDVQVPPDSPELLLTSISSVLSYGVAGAVLIDRRPDLPFGWLLAGVATTEAVATPATIAAYGSWTNGGFGAWVQLGAMTTSLMFLPVAVQGLVNVRFPSGRTITRGARVLEGAIAVGTALGVLGGALSAASVIRTTPSSSAPMLDRPPPESGVAGIAALLQAWVPVVVLLGLVAGIGVVVRARRSSGIERRQLAWRAAGVLVALALFPFAVAEVTPHWLDALDPPLFVVTLAIPVLRHHLWEIDTLVRRSLVYGAVTAALVAVYVALTALGTTFVPERVSASIAAVAIACAFAPLRTRVQSLLDRYMYGDRHDPYRTIRDLDRHLVETAASGEVLPAIVETIGNSLRLPYVAIERPDGTTIAAHGRPGPLVQRWSLVHEGTDEGQLVASPRRGEDEFAMRDRDLLADIARHAGVAVHAETLTADLRSSRQHLVATREEERRRIRRDLHDSLGPTLTGIGLTLDAARAQLTGNRDEIDGLLQDAKSATSAAITSVRRLVYGLRPPALDNLGLVGAIQQQANQLSSSGCTVRLDATAVPELPAAVEVAAYRMVVEAVTNSIRHGRARRCRIRLLAAADVLEIAVDDDGSGPAAWVPGVGLLSMREQAEELGGSVEAGPCVGGSVVCARYPITETRP